MATSPPTIDTRERILDRARTIANRDGVEAVTTRTLAGELGISPGNVSYHFPRRSDVVVALAEELTSRNEPLGEMLPESLPQLLERYRRTLEHQHAHRGVVLGLPRLLVDHPDLRRRYAEVERRRFGQQRAQLGALVAAGQLTLDPVSLDRCVATIGLVARFWLAEQSTTHAGVALDRVIAHYVGMIANVLLPWCREAAVVDVEPYVAAMLPLLGPPRRGDRPPVA